MDIPLLSNSLFCGPPGYPAPTPLLTLRDLLADRALNCPTPETTASQRHFSYSAGIALGHDVPRPMHFHWVISQVCGLWRAVALHTPFLWSRIGLGDIISIGKTCFARSYELPLTLIITSSTFDASSIPNFIRHRIRHLELALPVVLTESLFKLPGNSFGSLRSITIRAFTRAPQRDDQDDHYIPCFTEEDIVRRQGPPLTRPIFFSPEVGALPWTQLTELCLEGLNILWENAVYVLEMSSGLLRCSLEIQEASAFYLLFPVNPPPVVPLMAITQPVTALALLSLDIFLRSDPGDFFQNLILPSLKELSIKHRIGGELPCSALTRLQRQSDFSLERFSLTNRSGDSLLPFLQSNPQLRYLQLMYCRPLEVIPLAAALTRKQEGDALTLLPHLAELKLINRWAEEVTSETWKHATKAVVELAWSRWRRRDNTSISCLETFTFGSSAGFELPRKLD
ncbi:hypothetical protein C8J57DRAFT_1348188, partial [Mycena rebaudengoi]